MEKDQLWETYVMVFMTPYGFGIGYLTGYAIYSFGDTNTYDGRIQLIKDLDLQWLLCGLALLWILVVIMNAYSMTAKSALLGRKINTISSNKFVLKYATDELEVADVIVLN